jgi:hypothetical protein
MRETFHFRIDRQPPRAGKTLPSVQCRIALLTLILAVSVTATGQQLRIGSAPGGVTILAGGGNNYSTSFGTMNALGIGTPTIGVTVLPLSNGALYYTTFDLIIPNVPGSHKGVIDAYMSSNFGRPAAFVAESCPVNGSCTTSGGYAPISTIAANASDIVPAPGIDNQTVTAGLALFIPDNNGGTAYTGTDTATITLQMWDSVKNNKKLGNPVILTLTTQTVQTAVQLTLGTAPGGVTITPSADFSINFGNVNGLGIGPGGGLTTSSVPGGMIYHTPYLLNPAFAAFSSTTATIKVYVSADFVHPTILGLYDATASGGPYNAVSKNVGAQTQITTAAADRPSITRYLGLFVSNINGPTAFNGTDTATLTFTLTVP